MCAESSKKTSSKSQVKKDSKTPKGIVVHKRMAEEIPPNTKKSVIKKGRSKFETLKYKAP